MPTSLGGKLHECFSLHRTGACRVRRPYGLPVKEASSPVADCGCEAATSDGSLAKLGGDPRRAFVAWARAGHPLVRTPQF
eukprot:scaffold2136_cov242-Pinguiococcus_pyrenoidosus.AAC.12